MNFMEIILISSLILSTLYGVGLSVYYKTIGNDPFSTTILMLISFISCNTLLFLIKEII